MQSQVANRASHFVKAKMDHARVWLVHCSQKVSTMLTATDNRPEYPDREDGSIDLVSNFESVLIEFQSLLIWENPCNSAFALTCFTCLYWLVVLWSPRLFSIIAVAFFCYHFYEMWTRFVWPEIRVPSAETKENWTSVNPNVLSAPEIQAYIAKMKSLVAQLFCEIADLRRRSHGTFCFLSISFLAVFYFLGKCIPGVLIVYSFAILLFLTPGFLLFVLPHHMLEAAIEQCTSLVSAQGTGEVPKNCEAFDNDQEENSSDSESSTVKKEPSTPASHEGSSNSSRRASSHFNSHFDENFFANENAKSKSTSTSDISDDFEIISEADLQ